MDSEEPDVEEVFLIPLILKENPYWKVGIEATLRFFALIVSPVEGEPDVFRRVGLDFPHYGWEFGERHLVDKFLEQFPKEG